MIIWHADAKHDSPVQMECETPGYPNRTTTDEPMYDNTHFSDKADAWDRLIKEIEAYVNLYAGNRTDLQAKLAAQRLVAAKSNREREET